MSQIPFLGWIAIILIAGITIAVNLGLFALLRNRGRANELSARLKSRPPNPTIQSIQRMREVLRDPFKSERQQLGELSNLVSNLEQTQDVSKAERPPEKE